MIQHPVLMYRVTCSRLFISSDYCLFFEIHHSHRKQRHQTYRSTNKPPFPPVLRASVRVSLFPHVKNNQCSNAAPRSASSPRVSREPRWIVVKDHRALAPHSPGWPYPPEGPPFYRRGRAVRFPAGLGERFCWDRTWGEGRNPLWGKLHIKKS